MGRKTTFTREVGDAICDRLANGESLRDVCLDDAFPTERTVREWALDNVGKSDDYEGFGPQYARAREMGYLRLAEELLDIADNGQNDWIEKRLQNDETIAVVNHEHINRSRLRVDTRKWILSKMLPKVYGDKIVTEHTGPGGAPLTSTMAIVTPGDAARAYQDALKRATQQSE